MNQITPWRKYSIEAFVIVVSILLAFGIDAIWDEFQERSEEAELIIGLSADFEANLTQLRDIIDRHLSFGDSVVKLESMTETELQALTNEEVGQYLLAMWGHATFDTRDGTLDAIIDSGKLGLVRNMQLREMLIEWKSGIDDLQEEANDIRDAAQKVIARMTALGGPWAGDTPWRVSAADEPRIAAAIKQLPSANILDIAHDSELLAFVREKHFRAVLYVNQLILLERQGTRTLDLLKEQ